MGVKINGIHESELGVYTYVESRPILPELKSATEDVSSRDGIFDFSDINADNHAHYKTRLIKLTIYFEGETGYSMPLVHQVMMKWFCSPKLEVVFDDIPAIVWTGRLRTKIDPNRLAVTMHSITIDIECESANRLLWDTKGPRVGMDIPLETKVMLDETMNFTFQISKEQDIIVPHYGDWYVKPCIEVSGSFRSILLKDEKRGRYIKAENSNGFQNICIDCLREYVLAGDKNITDLSEGNFLELHSGENIIHVSGSGLNCTLFFNFYAKYLYGGDLFATNRI